MFKIPAVTLALLRSVRQHWFVRTTTFINKFTLKSLDTNSCTLTTAAHTVSLSLCIITNDINMSTSFLYYNMQLYARLWRVSFPKSGAQSAAAIDSRRLQLDVQTVLRRTGGSSCLGFNQSPAAAAAAAEHNLPNRTNS